jgi:hypothetical protein
VKTRRQCSNSLEVMPRHQELVILMRVQYADRLDAPMSVTA